MVPPFAIGRVPVTPVVRGRPMTFVITPEAGVPSAGVTNVGEVANTSAPAPVSSVTAARRFAELGVPRKVATPVPRPETPVLIGSPVQLVNVPLDGVPKTGVTNVGLVERTLLPEPVFVTLTMFLLASSARAVDAVRPDRVAVLDAESVVNPPAPEKFVAARVVPFHVNAAESANKPPVLAYVTRPEVRLDAVTDVPENAPPVKTIPPTEPGAMPSAVTTPAPVVVVLGAAPAPPPRTNAFAASNPDDANVPVAV